MSIQYELQVLLTMIIVTKKGNKHIMSGLFCASLAAYMYIRNVTFSRQLLIPNYHKGVQE